MSKVITLRYDAKCRVCKKPIPAGTRAYWYGKRQGSAHIECQNPVPVPGQEQPAFTVLQYPELREGYLKSFGGNASAYLKNPTNISHWRNLEDGRRSPGNWAGSTNDEMLKWLQIGYMVPGLSGVENTLMSGAPKRKLIFAEEGDEMLLDLAWSGVEECFITWERRATKPSLKVEISIAFSAVVDAKMINDYQLWVAQMLQTIDAFDIDMQIDLISAGRGQWQERYDHEHTVKVRVKESGEISDYSNWSPMFSPGGFRQMMFLGIIKCADIRGIAAASSLGSPRGCDEWAVKYDPDTSILRVTNNNRDRHFPADYMTQQFAEIMSQLAKH